jgi:dihydroorotate dehydrogenase
MYKLIRPVLFNLYKDPETVHHEALAFLRIFGISPLHQLLAFLLKVDDSSLKQTVFGLDFKNPVGLAGGFDKEAVAVRGLAALGFGFLEVGTITQHAQSGNPRPRIFRLTEDEALINRMGFNNFGADALAKKLSQLKNLDINLGISLGKSKITELEKATDDYLYSFSKLYEYGDYFVVNISSPNTPGLRQLHDKNFLLDILSVLNDYRLKQDIQKPIFVKTVVDLTLEAIDEVLEICRTQKVDGIIISNTLLSRDGLKVPTNEVGGLSGKPIKQKSTDYIRYIHKRWPTLPIIGVGGIFTAEDAYEKIKAGASLIQIYTGFIYEGPSVVKKINQGLVKCLQRDGFKNIKEAVGVAVK